MHKNNLDLKVFQGNNGKNYGLAVGLDKKRIKSFFQGKGFNIIYIHQIFRHTHGKLEKDKHIYFFKMASSKDISERTYNESIWNKKISFLINRNHINYFSIPKIISSGYFEDKFYYISDFFNDRKIAIPYSSNKRSLKKWLNKIICANLYLLDLKDKISLPRDENEYSGKVNFYKIFYNQDCKLLQDLKEFSLEGLLEIERILKRSYAPSLNHGDFVPWHMIIDKNRFILVDSEHGSCKLPKYFDIVYFYTKVYVKAENPTLAKIYLNLLRNNISVSDKNLFDLSIKPLIANRIIDLFWHTKNERLHNFKYCLSLKKDLLNNELF